MTENASVRPSWPFAAVGSYKCISGLCIHPKLDFHETSSELKDHLQRQIASNMQLVPVLSSPFHQLTMLQERLFSICK
ncbi:hypothetical protein D0Y65_004283 [Glycine soja]|uniref:Uncharacterized protein n=1 Tax=Glycine soja TaxID=3848 RepID=A0A445LQE4_GLYSO|nr:hypothetical protein D0Y65_004283 [Glycine soja]RZC25519.1 hypothetical protein D0Y65_004283 [Glycine soja]RZC25520.1 hypothetical protein D0Y65_004283 [Glycine soja]RZC25521.1 hypothetical protein D0Y65_004283 [Glycine soja]RZC25522.1 hypothetical protein D0Y65_004283 [Glycine soja]